MEEKRGDDSSYLQGDSAKASLSPRNVALVHDWLNGMRGGEKVLEVIAELFPHSKIFTLLLERERISDALLSHEIRASFIQRLPFWRRKYRNYLPLFPRAIEKFDFTGFDLVISSSHCVAKGAIPAPGALHICFCHSPIRYVWQFYEQYFGRNPLKKLFLKPVLNKIRRWDYETCSRVTHFIANSENVAGRIRRFYGREADVIYPPVDTAFFTPGEVERREDYYMMVSALVPYKRVDLAVSAFNRMRLPLRIIGRGPELRRLRGMALPNVTFHGWLSNEEVREHYRNCRALIFPGEEDFGMTPVEANACGTPVIAYGGGGVLESVVDGETGLFFREQTEDSLISAVEQFEKMELDPKACREQSLQFDNDVFRQRFSEYVRTRYGEFCS